MSPLFLPMICDPRTWHNLVEHLYNWCNKMDEHMSVIICVKMCLWGCIFLSEQEDRFFRIFRRVLTKKNGYFWGKLFWILTRFLSEFWWQLYSSFSFLGQSPEEQHSPNRIDELARKSTRLEVGRDGAWRRRRVTRACWKFLAGRNMRGRRRSRRWTSCKNSSAIPKIVPSSCFFFFSFFFHLSVSH